MFGPALLVRQLAIFDCLRSLNTKTSFTANRVAITVGISAEDAIRDLFELHRHGVIDIRRRYQIVRNPLPAPLVGYVEEDGTVHWTEPTLTG